ncbi:hypothetical protein QBC39DRAFT_351729 [Podospora conica]|nr:hypothetical protein QBC39DRAFT_351729 [Schizothecium conicum]
MATPAAIEAVATAATKSRRVLFPIGGKKIYLPDHVITFIRPKPNQPANHATFVVPLSFNKLDLRDYLYNVYNVRVKAVRSFINHIPVKATASNRWSRGKAQKMMIADLLQPFRWPEPLAEDEREQFDYEQFKRMDDWVTKQKAEREERYKGKIPLQSKEPVSERRANLRKQMDEFLANPELWKEGGRPLQKISASDGEGQWEEVEADLDSAFDDVQAAEAEREKAEKP